MVFWSVHFLILCPLAQASNPDSSSSTVAMQFTTGTSGPSSFPASCTLVLWVCIRYLCKTVAALRANTDDVAMGVVFAYQNAVPDLATTPWSGLPYYAISLSFNILLTIMIVIRLILQAKNTRTTHGMTGIGGLYKAIVTMLIESCALYTVSSLLVIGPWAVDSPITNVFLPILNQIQVSTFLRSQLRIDCLMRRRIGQVIAPLFIIQRVANRSALTRPPSPGMSFCLKLGTGGSRWTASPVGTPRDW